MAIHHHLSAALVCAATLLSAVPSLAAESSIAGLKEIPQLGLGTWLSDRNKAGSSHPARGGQLI